MKSRIVAFLGAVLLAPGVLLAGEAIPRNVPTLGEMGLLMLAAGLVGGGAILLRKRR